MSGRANVMQPESARLPRVKRLIVVAGPCCAGKSTLIAALQRGELPMLRKTLEMDDPLDWAYVHAYELPGLSGMYAEHLVLHYDFQAQRSLNGYRFLAGLLRNADHAAFLTLQVQPEMLVRRNRSRLAGVAGAFFRRPKNFSRFVRRLRDIANRHFLYRDPHAVSGLYDNWFRFCTACGGYAHWVVDASGEQAGWDLTAVNRESPRKAR